MRQFSIALLFAAAMAGLTPAVTFADEDGQEDLDKATELKLTARNLRDLDKVSDLCESAIEKGLDEDGESFAKELWASTLFEYSTRLAEPILEQQPPDRRWKFLRGQAISRLDQAVKLKPNWPEAYLLLGRFHALAGDDVPLTDPLAVFLAIRQLEELPNGDREAALEALDKAVENIEDADPTFHARIYLWRGVLAKENVERLELLNKAIEADAKNSDALRVRSLVHVVNENMDEAAEDFRKLIEREPENLAYRQSLIEMLTNAEQYDEALEQMGVLIEENPESPEVYLMRARLNLLREDGEAALEDLNQVLELKEDDPLALLLRSRVYLDLEMLDEAREDVDELLKQQPDIVDGILTRSMIATAEEDYEAAARDMELLVQARPDNLPWVLQLAMLYYADDRPSKSIETYSRALALDNKSFFALRGRGDAFLGMGKHIDAAEDYERAFEVDPEDSALLNNYSWLLSTSPDDEVRDGERAIELATKAAELTEYEQAHILSTLAAGYAETGDFEKAREWSTKAVELASEGEQRENLTKELENYKKEEPWRERQEEKDREESKQKSDLDL